MHANGDPEGSPSLSDFHIPSSYVPTFRSHGAQRPPPRPSSWKPKVFQFLERLPNPWQLHSNFQKPWRLAPASPTQHLATQRFLLLGTTSTSPAATFQLSEAAAPSAHLPAPSSSKPKGFSDFSFLERLLNPRQLQSNFQKPRPSPRVKQIHR